MMPVELADKVVARGPGLQARLAALPRPLVFTNGVFDVLHRGHVSYLHRARQLGASLLVGLNTDASTRGLGKGADRPLNAEADRALVLAGLAAVDLVIGFDEPTPVALLREVRPELYVKGGDYRMEALEETRVVAAWGGRALALPFVEGYSTTAMVGRIRSAARPLRRAAFLDRDGVINRDHAYVHRWSDFDFVPGAVDAMRRLKAAGWTLVVVTNQAGLARGLYTEAQYQALTGHMCAALAAAGAEPAAVYHCPHHPAGTVAALAIECDCRKPAPGMLLRAARELGLSLADSILVGDKASDIEAGRRAGLGRVYGVHSENADSAAQLPGADASYADLAACVDALLAGPGTMRA
jgi:D-glycero-D-manno-heptose 1,7-bisphosphate phosphatase